MGFLDFLKGEKKLQCPNCGADGAKQLKDGTIRCPNRACPNFDAGLAGAATPANWTAAGPPAGGPLSGLLSGLKSKKGGFVPARPITIRYRNFQNQWDTTRNTEPVRPCIRRFAPSIPTGK